MLTGMESLAALAAERSRSSPKDRRAAFKSGVMSCAIAAAEAAAAET